MALFRDDEILCYLYDAMDDAEAADFEAVLDTSPLMQDRFDNLLGKLVLLHNIDSFWREDSLNNILSFAYTRPGIDSIIPTCQTSFWQYN